MHRKIIANKNMILKYRIICEFYTATNYVHEQGRK